MIFLRILDNNLYHVKETDNLGFEKSEGLFIPDEYLDRQEFMVMKTASGIGDWGIVTAMPRLLKEKYPNCKVVVPSKKLLKKLFGQEHNNVHITFDNNPYVDGFVDKIDGEVYHDHYRIYDKDNPNIPLVKQMLTFWQFNEEEIKDSQPEVYWSGKERELGDAIIDEYVGNKEFGCLLISDRFGTQYGKYDEESYKNDYSKVDKLLNDNKLPYFYWSYKDLDDMGYNTVDKVLDMKHMHLRIQLYIKSKAKVNISNQCGANHIVARYSDCYEVQRQFPIAHNFVEGETYL
jgi:hypothetical protein